jgi:O-antigen ligase
MYFVGRYVVDTNAKVLLVVKWSAISVALAGAIAILQGVFGIQLDAGYQKELLARSGTNSADLAAVRSYGTLISQAAFGVLSALGVLMSFALFAAVSRPTSKMLAACCSILCFLGLLLSGTRSAILGIAIALLPVLWLVMGRPLFRVLATLRMRRDSLLVLAGALLIVVAATFVVRGSIAANVTNIQGRLATISPVAWIQGSVREDRNVQGRIGMWRPVWEAIVQRPVMGYGTGALGGGSEEVRIGVKPVNGMTLADNQYLELGGEFGLLGVLLYVTVIVANLVNWTYWRGPWLVRVWVTLAASASLLFLVSGVGNAPLDYYPANAFFWLLTGVSANASALRREARSLHRN